MPLVIHACIGMPMASHDCENVLDAHSMISETGISTIWTLFRDSFHRKLPNDIGAEKDEHLMKLTVFPSPFISNLRT